jgi:hypothetical protein
MAALNYGENTNLSNVDASFRGMTNDSGTGYRTAILGDVNGDGYDDIAIASPFAGPSVNMTGTVHIFFGNKAGYNMDTNLSNANASFLGLAPGDQAGGGLAGAGDIDKDGYDDIIIGAPTNWSTGGDDSGAVYIIYGKADGWALDTNLSTADITLDGENPSDNAGNDVDGVGDVNGDGYDDFVVGARQNGDAGANAGKVYLFLGRGRAQWSGFATVADSNASYTGEVPGDNMGTSVGGAGDVNGDRLDDFLVGAPDNDELPMNGGKAYLILGQETGWANDVPISEANASFLGGTNGDQAGYKVSGAGDVNGDGYDDILIGSPYNITTGNMAGKTHLVFGMASGWASNMSLMQSNASWMAEKEWDRFGLFLTGAGDVNGDGFDDIHLGAISTINWYPGESYLILGNTSGWAKNDSLDNADCSFVGEALEDRAGAVSNGYGDVNGDGYDDLLVGAFYNDELAAGAGQAYLIIVDDNSFPDPVSDIRAYFDPEHTREAPEAQMDDVMYIRLEGTDKDPNRRDIAVTNVTSDASPFGFRLRLLETSESSGVYVGNFSIKKRTHDSYRWIGTDIGETVNVASFTDPDISYDIYIGNSIKMFPFEDNITATEDSFYMMRYWTGNWPTEVWEYHSDADWLSTNAVNHTFTGTPNNGDVGVFDVGVNLTDGTNTDRRVFTLTVENTPPSITTSNITEAMERVPYLNDYNSTDDGNGTITWHLDTNGTWLAMNSTTGVLSGTPGPGTNGSYYVNVSVDDGNDGWNSTNFTVVVANFNDRPNITTIDNQTAYEDDLYIVDYSAEDIDIGDVLTWSMATNASEWLQMDGEGTLSGTPSNDDVGDHWVNVTVKDVAGANDSSNFTLTVLNTNDRPVITSIPSYNTIALLPYHYDVEAYDVDIGDHLVYSLEESPDDMGINVIDGDIEWTPDLEQQGQHEVTVKVDDGKEPVYQNFMINVTVLEAYIPHVVHLTPLDGALLDVTTPALSWEATDVDSEVIYFDVYIDEVLSNVEDREPSCKLAERELVRTIIVPPNILEQGETYYWTVIPHDGENEGIDLSGIWSFTISDDAVADPAPKVVLNRPPDGEHVERIPVQLVWSGDDSDSVRLYYDVYLHTNRTRVENHDATARIASGMGDEWLIMEDLKAGSQYFWTVVPNDGDNIGECLSGVWDFRITLSAARNGPPVIESDPVIQLTVGETYQYQVIASDPDEFDTLTFYLMARPLGMVIDHKLGLILWVPKADLRGNHSVIVRVSDGKVFVEQAFHIEIVTTPVENTAPTITSTAVTEVVLGSTYYYQVMATDPDKGDVLVYSLVTYPSGMEIDKDDGLITWTPAFEQIDIHPVAVLVTDGKALTYHYFNITVKEEVVPPPPPGPTDPDSHIWEEPWFLALMVLMIAVIVAVAIVASRRSSTKDRKTKIVMAQKDAEAHQAKAEAAQAQAELAQVKSVMVPVEEGVEDFQIKEIFVIYNDGRLIAHLFSEKTHRHDKDLMSGMLVAIQGFVKASFSAATGLDSFEFTGNKVVLVGGEYVIIAVVLEGVEPRELRDQMGLAVNKVEGMHAGVIERWDGDTQKLGQTEVMVAPLMNLRTSMKIKKKKKGVRAKSGVEFFSGYVRLRVAISNETEERIGNISITLDYDTKSLFLSHINPEYQMQDATIYLDDVDPGEKRSVAIYFDPTICQESHIDGHIYYTDASGEQQYTTMKRRPVDVVCPIFYTKETVNVAMLKRLLTEVDYDDLKVYKIERLAILKTAYREALATVKAHDVKLVREYETEDPWESEAWFYGEVKETEEKIVIRVSARHELKSLEIFVATSNLASMTGLLAELGSNFYNKIKERNLQDHVQVQGMDVDMIKELSKTQLLLDKLSE